MAADGPTIANVLTKEPFDVTKEHFNWQSVECGNSGEEKWYPFVGEILLS